LFLGSRFFSCLWKRYAPPKRRFLQEPHGVTSQKTSFFNNVHWHTLRFELTSCGPFPCLTLQPCIQKEYSPPKRRWATGQHGVISVTTALLTNAAFWAVASCGPWCFGETCRFYLQGRNNERARNNVSSNQQTELHCEEKVILPTLKMEATHSSVTSVLTRSIQHHIPEDGILHGYRC
jgi:hypothetical protein